MIVICLLMENRSVSLNLIIKILRKHIFSLEITSNKFGAIDSREVSLERSVYDFLVDCNAINKSDVLSIRKYLMAKNNI